MGGESPNLYKRTSWLFEPLTEISMKKGWNDINIPSPVNEIFIQTVLNQENYVDKLKKKIDKLLLYQKVKPPKNQKNNILLNNLL